MVYQFSDCMGWLNPQEIGVSADVSHITDLVMIKPVTGYFITHYVYISKKDLNFKSVSDFVFDRNFNYKIYTVNRGFFSLDEERNPDHYTFSSNDFINGRKLDLSTIQEAY